MGKGKGRMPSQHLQSRISYLHQAAIYMQSISDGRVQDSSSPVYYGSLKNLPPKFLQKKPRASMQVTSQGSDVIQTSLDHPAKREVGIRPQICGSGQTRHFISHLKAVALKGQVRLEPDLKHSICKKCDSLLIAGSTSTSEVENPSRGRLKPWADILVVTCTVCGTKKRFPQGSKRQMKRSKRIKSSRPRAVSEEPIQK